MSGAAGERFIPAGAAQDRANARHQFPRIERLRQIIVGADLKANNAVDIFSARGQQQHRQPRGRADAPQHFETIDPGQHDIQHHQQVTAAGGALQAALAVMHGIDHEAFRLQILAHQRAKFDIIVDHQNTFHVSGSHCAPCHWRTGKELSKLTEVCHS